MQMPTLLSSDTEARPKARPVVVTFKPPARRADSTDVRHVHRRRRQEKIDEAPPEYLEVSLSRLLAKIPSLLSKSSTLIIDGTGLPHDRHGEAWVLQFVDSVGSFLRENKQSHRVVSLVVAAPGWVWSEDGADRLWKASGFLVHETARAVERHMRTKQALVKVRKTPKARRTFAMRPQHPPLSVDQILIYTPARSPLSL